MAAQREPEPVERQEVTSSERQLGSLESREQIRIIKQSGEPDASTSNPEAGATSVEHRERFVRDAASERRLKLHKANELIWLLVGIIEGLIGLRVLLKLIAANPDSLFARFLYNIAALFLWPFAGLTGSPSAGGMVLEIPSIIAMLFYALLGWAVIRLIWVLFEETKARSTSTYDRYRS